MNCASAALGKDGKDGKDGIVRPQWVKQQRYDHHYARLAYARWLTAALRHMKYPAGVILR